MRRIAPLLAIVLGLVTLQTGVAGKQPAAPSPQGPAILNPGAATAVDVVTYIEVTPGAERDAIGALKAYRDATKQEPGSQRVDVLQQNERPTHFVVLEAWENKSAFDAHDSRTSTRQLNAALAQRLGSPLDQRLFNPFDIVAKPQADAAIYVVTHVDTIPPQTPSPQSDPGPMLKQLAESSRKEEGNARFNVWQSDRKNHFTLVEAWRNQRAFDAHAAAAHTKKYRDQLQPLAGSPLDERVFIPVK